MTIFNNSNHHALMMTSDKIGDSERVRFSDVVVSALIANGIFDDRFVINAAAPADTSKIWVDPLQDPATVNAWDGATWVPAKFFDVWKLGDKVSRAGDTMTGQLAMHDGTLASPALAWSADTGTGWIRTGPGTIAYVTGGQIVMSIGPNGVSIEGTSSVINSDNLSIEDNTIVLNRGETGAGVSAGVSGVSVERGTLADAGVTFNESTDQWEAGIAGAMKPIVTSVASTGGGESLISSYAGDSVVFKSISAGSMLVDTITAGDITLDVDLSLAPTVTTAASGDFLIIDDAGGVTRRVSVADFLSTIPASDTAPGLVELATNAETQAGTDAARAVTPASLASLTATQARRGLVELATNAETQAGTGTARAVTPASLASLTATQARRGLIELATDTEAQAGTDTERAITPASLAAVTASDTRAGLIETATVAETLAGADAGRAVTPAGLAGLTASQTRSGLVELATNAETQAGTDAARAVTPASLASLTATNGRRGIVELATAAETAAGTDGVRAVTPSALFDATTLDAIAEQGFDGQPAISAAETAALTGAEEVIVELADGTLRRTPFTTLQASPVAATTTVSGVIEIATNAEVAAGTDSTRAVTPSSLLQATTVDAIIESAFDGQPAITAAQIAALSGSEEVLIELADGALRRIAIDDLPKPSITDNGTTITHNDGAGNTVTFREGRSYFSQNAAPAAAEIGDHWFQPVDAVLYELVNDGGSNIWIEISGGGSGSTNGIVDHGEYTPATLPPAADYLGGVVYITGGLGGGTDDCMVYSDGVNWRKVQNGTIQA